MADIPTSDTRPDPVWRALGRNLATGVGALAALLSLLAGTSVTTACLRGGAALCAVLLLTRVGSAALAAIERAEGEPQQRQRPQEPAVATPSTEEA